MSLFNKLRDIKFEIEMKASDLRYTVADKFDDVKDFVGDKVDDVKYFVEDKVDELKYFVGDKVDVVKEFAGDKLNIKSKGDVAEVAAYVLFPQQIPLKLIMSSMGKNASSNIQSKNDQLSERVEVLEGMQNHGAVLEEKIQHHFSDIQSVSNKLHAHLIFFAECFERIHNRPTFGIKEADGMISFDQLFDTTVPMADFAKLDDYLITLYDENASILQGLLRTPIFAAILRLP